MRAKRLESYYGHSSGAMTSNRQFIEKFPVATWTTAFFAGMSITVIRMAFDVLQARGRVSHANHDALFPFVAIYFLSTLLIFVIDIRNIVPKEFRLRLPWRIKRDEFHVILKVWGRMFVWFLGGVAGVLPFLPFMQP
jgi:hypothetical protein